MASNYPPKKNVAFTMYFFVHKNDGTIIANPTLTGSNVHVDGNTTEVTDSTLAVVDSTTGLCSIVLAQATMNGDQIDGTVTSSSTGAVVKTFKLMTAANTQDEIGTDVAAVHTHVGTIDGHITADYGSTEKAAIDLLDDADGGLADVHTDVGTAITNIGDVHATDLPALKTVADNIATAVITNAAGTDVAADIIAIKAVADTIQADTDLLDDAAGGIADIHTDLGTLTTTVGAAGAGLTALPAVTLANGAHGGAAATLALGGAGGLTGVITGNVTGSVGSVTGAVGSVSGDTKQTADVSTLIATVGAAGVGLTALASQASVDTIDNLLDTEVAAITAAVITNAAGTDIAADIIALKAETAAILEDTGTTLDTLIKDIPTNAELTTALGTADDAMLAAIAALVEAGFKKNTAVTGFPFFMASSSDHITGVAGLTITATRSLDGAAFAACANAATEISAGWYKIDLAAADMNADMVVLKFTATGADAIGYTIKTSA